MWKSVCTLARRAASQPSARAVAGAAVAASCFSGVAACEASEGAYVYLPPGRKADELAAAAAEASKPRVRVPHKPHPRVLFVLGGPGAGKGTQCAMLVKEYGFVHLSAGDLLREERDSGSPDGEMIENYIREGKIVPVEVTVKLLQKAMARSKASKFLIDGFPRNFDNLEGWNTVVGDAAIVDGVLQFDVADDVMVGRLLERGKTSGRSDDNIVSIKKRLQVYADSTKKVLDHFASQGKLSVIDGDRPVSVVFADTQKAVEGTVQAEVLAYNGLLLDSVSSGDWQAYSSLVDQGVTCFEPEAADAGLVTGLSFHQRLFEEGAKQRAKAALAGKPISSLWSSSSMQGAEVRLLGPKHALVTYTRHTSPLEGSEGPVTVTRSAETRVWRLGDDGKWRLAHFHRSPMSPLQA